MKTPIKIAREFLAWVDGLNSVPGMMTSHDLGKESVCRTAGRFRMVRGQGGRGTMSPHCEAIADVCRRYLLAQESTSRPEDDPDPQSGPPTMAQLASAIIANVLAAAEAERSASPSTADRLLALARVEIDRMRAALTGSHSIGRPL